MCKFCLLITCSGLKYMGSVVPYPKTVGREALSRLLLCLESYWVKNEMTHLKNKEVSLFSLRHCLMWHAWAITWQCREEMSRKDAGSKQEATASITRLTPWFGFYLCIQVVFKKERLRTCHWKLVCWQLLAFSYHVCWQE